MKAVCSIGWTMTIVLTLFSVHSSAAVLQVPQHYATIQEGIDAATAGDTVLLADGTYSGSGNINLDYHGKAITVISQSGPETCVLMVDGDDYGVRFASGETSDALCEGITFKSDQGPVSIDQAAAIYCVNSSPTIQQCIFERVSTATYSATAILLTSSNAHINGCTITGRTDSISGTGFVGIIARDSSPTLASCTINGSGSGGISQGLQLTNCTATINASTFRNCHARFWIFFADGGAVQSQDSTLTMLDCVVQNCSAKCGGGLMLTQTNAVIRDSQILGNSATSGAGINAVDSEVLIEGCVISDNLLARTLDEETPNGGGIYCTGASHLTIRSTTIANNRSEYYYSDLETAGNGIYCTAPDLLVEDCEIIDNKHAQSHFLTTKGGGVYCDSARFNRTIFTGNEAKWGGAVHGANLVVSDCSFSGNQATFGGALAITTAQTDIASSEFSDNTAIVGCHIIATALPASITIADCTFSGIAGDYYLAPGYAFDLQTSIFEGDAITQDVYVAITGNDANSGLDLEHPFRSLTHALRSVAGNSENQVVVHVGPGRYAALDEREHFPLVIPSYVTLAGASMSDTLICGDNKEPAGFSYAAVGSKLQSLTIMNSASSEWGALNCIASAPTIERCLLTSSRWLATSTPLYGSNWALYCIDSSPLLTNCILTDNNFYDFVAPGGQRGGGAIGCFGDSSPRLSDCIIAANTAEMGGGLYCEGTGSPEVLDSVFYANRSEINGAALYATEQTALTIYNSLFIDNEGPDFGVILNSEAFVAGSTFYTTSVHCDASALTITDSILWSRWGSYQALSVDQLETPTITYCDIQGGYEGQGNINSDPIFTQGPWGSYYLSSQAAGQDVNSPCVNAGSKDAAEACYEKSEGLVCYGSLTTITTQALDIGRLNLGYHYWPVPDSTLSVELNLSLPVFTPGDEFMLTLNLTSDAEETLRDIPFAVVLHAYGHYYCYPTWNESFQLVLMDIEPGRTSKVLLEFTWPEEPSVGEGVEFFAAPLYRDMSGLVCEPGYVEFGWEP